MITLVVAVSKNGVIGKDNKLIWHLPQDLKRFKSFTINQIVVMGRKTHESIGKVLPNRINVILTTDKSWKSTNSDDLVICHSIEEVIEKFKGKDLFIIGGSKVYEEFLPLSDVVEMTYIEKEYDGDTFFPRLTDEWIEVERIHNTCEDFEFDFVKYKKI